MSRKKSPEQSIPWADLGIMANEDWPLKKIGALGEIDSGFSCGKHNSTGSGIAQLRPFNIDVSGNISLREQKHIPLNAIDGPHRLTQRGDVLFNNTNSPALVGKTAVIDDGIHLPFSNHITRIRPNDHLVIPKYLGYWLTHLQQRGIFELSSKNHVSQASINAPVLASLTIPLPDPTTQKFITGMLAKIGALHQEAMGKLKRSRAILRRFRRSVLASAYDGSLTEDWRNRTSNMEPIGPLVEIQRAKIIASKTGKLASIIDDRARLEEKWEDVVPSSWQVEKIGSVFRVELGTTPRRNQAHFWGGQIPWVSSGEVAFCRIIETAEKITKAGMDAARLDLLPKGTVLLAMIGEGKTRGQAAILDVPACHNQNAAAIILEDTGFPPEFVYFYFRRRYEMTREMGAGNSQQALNKARVQAIPIPLPPISEQIEICSRVNALLAITDRLESQMMSVEKRLDRTFESAIAAAFRGELVTSSTEQTEKSR